MYPKNNKSSKTFSLTLGKSTRSFTGTDRTKLIIYKPKTRHDLYLCIQSAIYNQGPNVDLSGVDVSEVTDMSRLFVSFSKFKGDISKWDVSNVTNMKAMFAHSEFNGGY